jgi:cytochrome c-type biogenesis protein CcmH
MSRWSGRQRNVAWLVLIGAIIVVVFAGIATANHGPKSDAERAYDIKKTILCPACDGQNILESNAPIATSLRALVDDLVAEGDSDDEIRDQIVSIYDESVNAIPPATGLGSLVWIIPVAGLIVVIGGLVFSFKRWSDAAATDVSAADRALVEQARNSP